MSREEVLEMGFARVGESVQISDKASIYNCPGIELGSNVRIDDFSVISAGIGGVSIGNYVHIAVSASLIGAGKITLSDFCGLSSRVSVYSSNDDYLGHSLTGPMVSEDYKKVVHKDVYLGRHVIVGSGSVILPGVHLGDGVAIGALSLVAKNCDAFGVYAGNPLRRVKSRSKKILEIEKDFLDSNS